jgi:hypothetical protein
VATLPHSFIVGQEPSATRCHPARSSPANASGRTVSSVICTPVADSRPKPHQIFRHAHPWQFAAEGRKWRVVQERQRRLARVMARFDASGHCRNVYPSIATVLRKLREAETDVTKPLTWSRRTVFSYLSHLSRAGVASRGGLTTVHGTRRRALHADRLLLKPIAHESCTPGRRESRTRRIYKKHQKPNSKADTSRHEKHVPATAATRQRTYDDVFMQAFHVLTHSVGAVEAGARVAWIAYRALQAGHLPESTRYYLKASKNFELQHEDHVREQLSAEGEDRLLRICPTASRLLDEMRATPEYKAAQLSSERELYDEKPDPFDAILADLFEPGGQP